MIWHNRGPVAERRLNQPPTGSLQLACMVTIDVVWILEQIAGKHRDDIRVTAHDARGGQFSDTGEGRRRSGLAADAGLPDHGFGVSDFLFADLLDSALRFTHLFEGFGPRNRVPDLD